MGQLQRDRAMVAYNALTELVDEGGLFADDDYALLLQAKRVCFDMATIPGYASLPRRVGS